MQIPGDNLILGRKNPFQLLVALSESGSARGNLFRDDGDSIGTFSSIFIFSFIDKCMLNLDSIDTKTYNYFEFSLTSSVS
jgi:hypothetical protein